MMLKMIIIIVTVMIMNPGFKVAIRPVTFRESD
jgi:hypothetical protein